MSQELDDQVEDNALGFSSDPAPTDEKYNTRFLVTNMEKDRKKGLMILGGALVGGLLILWMVFSTAGGSAPAPAPDAQIAPAVTAPAPEAAQPTEAPKP